MNSFDFKEVTLNDGMMKKVLDETLAFYLKIPNDNILKYMRESAGKPAPGIFRPNFSVMLSSGWIRIISLLQEPPEHCPAKSW